MLYPGRQFESITPEAAGIAGSAIADALQAIKESAKDIHSMLILRDGRLVFEQYFAPYDAETPHSMYSCSKTFTSMLIGIAQGNGLLSLHDRVLDYFPDVIVSHVSDNLRAMTLRDLLMMGSGHAKDTFGFMIDAPDGDFARAFLNRPVEFVPGTHFVYNTGATYMLSAVLQRVTGKTALQLADEWIFSKIGIEGAAWDVCPRGVCLGGTGLHIRPRDMARFGHLLLAGGRWEDEQIIPAAYVAEASQKHIENKNEKDPRQDPNWAAGYCYQLWRCAFDDCFRADGMGGQFIVVFPRRNMVVVFTSALGGDIGYPLNVVEKFLLPGVSDSPLPPAPEALASLDRLSASLRAPQTMTPPSKLPFDRLRLEDNPLRLCALTLTRGELCAQWDEGETRAAYGWGAPVVRALSGVTPYPELRDACIAGVALQNGETFFRLNVLGEPFTMTVRIKQAGDAMRVSCGSTRFAPFEVMAYAE